MHTFPTLANGELATVPHSMQATVETVCPDGIFNQYIVRKPGTFGGEYLYIGSSESDADKAADDWNKAGVGGH